MSKIQKIKQECIEIDLANVEAGDTSIGVYVGKKFIQFKDVEDIELFYHSISLKELLTIYSQYMGLKCLAQESDLTEEGYSIDILEIIELI